MGGHIIHDVTTAHLLTAPRHQSSINNPLDLQAKAAAAKQRHHLSFITSADPGSKPNQFSLTTLEGWLFDAYRNVATAADEQATRSCVLRSRVHALVSRRHAAVLVKYITRCLKDGLLAYS